MVILTIKLLLNLISQHKTGFKIRTANVCFHYKKFTFYYKPHPASKLDIKIFNRLNLKILKSENKKKFLFKKSISLGATSSVLEIKSSKNDLAVYVPPSSLDFSPTFKIKKFKKIYSSLDLLKFLND